MNRRHALVAAPHMPEFDRECGSRRIYDFIEFLLEAGWTVSFVAREAAGGERYQKMLQQRGVGVYVGFNSRVEQLIGAGRLDVALLAFWNVAEELLPIIRRLSPGTPILVDSIDLHFLRKSRATFQHGDDGEKPSLLDERFATEMMRELNVYASADAVLTVSQKEADLLADITTDAGLAHVVPLAENIARSDVPFAERKGILFVGNFRHAPNVGAVQYMCRDILPLIDPNLLSEHPVSIVGNGLTHTVGDFGSHLSHVSMVGWVPSLVPYLHRARVMAVPLLYGAGTKGKLVQALMAGVPTVSTTIGIEGLHLEDGRHVLVADDSQAFAVALERLLTDESLWQHLASEGRSHVAALHGRHVVRERLIEVADRIMDRPAKALPARWAGSAAAVKPDAYEQVISKIRQVVTTVLPAGARILVVSRGDERLLALDDRQAQHFPQVKEGVYAGHHPADSAAAIAHLEALRGSGIDYLLLPQTAFWWLDHYVDFRIHLDRHYDRVREDESCVIYRLTRKVSDVEPARSLDPDEIERLRPVVPDLPPITGANGNHSRKQILALGIYLANQPNTADHVVANLAGSSLHQVTQKWVALWGQPPSELVAGVTIRTEMRKVPKFELLNDVLGTEDLSGFDYVLLFDDDIVLPDRLDRFLPLQDRLGFVVAQPARTSNSYIDLPIVEQQRGCLARQTRFVEIGPVVSFHRSVFDLVFPFDMTSPMGWGYENIWSYQLAQRGLKMGIIDAVPVDHSTRKPVTNYKWSEADAQRKKLFKKHTHFTYDECFRVLAAIPLGGRG